MQFELELYRHTSTPAARSAAEFRQELLYLLSTKIGGLPKKMTIDEGEHVAVALDLYASLGADFTHFMRYFLGCLALRVKAQLGKGPDAIGQCAEAWSIAPTTLRFYAAAAKQTRCDVQAFDDFLVRMRLTTGRPATQGHVKTFGQALKDPEITPADVAEQILMRSIEHASEAVEKTLGELQDPDHVDTAVTIIADAVMSARTKPRDRPEHFTNGETEGVPRETSDVPPSSGLTLRQHYERRVEQLVEFFDLCYAEWWGWHKPDVEPDERGEIKTILRASIDARFPEERQEATAHE